MTLSQKVAAAQIQKEALSNDDVATLIQEEMAKLLPDLPPETLPMPAVPSSDADAMEDADARKRKAEDQGEPEAQPDASQSGTTPAEPAAKEGKEAAKQARSTPY